MAKRYGGQFSPNAETTGNTTPQPKPLQADPVGARSNIMFVPPIIATMTSVFSGAVGMTFGLAGAASLGLGAWLLREGIRAHAAYDTRRAARRPAIPRKLFAALAAGLGVSLLAFRNDGNLVASGLLALCVVALHVVAFGIDPMQDKGMEGIDTFQQDRVAKAIEGAQGHLRAMKDAIKRSGDRRLLDRVEQFSLTAQDLFRTVEEDPRDLTSARKYLSVYLQGARDATVAFSDLYSRSQDQTARDDYLTLLDDLEQNFAARTQKLLSDDRTDLTVEIEVLRERLGRETQRNKFGE